MPKRAPEFEVIPQGSRIEFTEVQGFDGQLTNLLNRRPKVIHERGWVDTDAVTLAELHAGEGNPAVTKTIDTLGKGVYLNCWLESVRLTGRTRGDGTKAKHVQYLAIWRPSLVGELS